MTTDDWRTAVQCEMRADMWYHDAEQEGDTSMPLSSNGNGKHPKVSAAG